MNLYKLKNGKMLLIRRAHPEDACEYAEMSAKCYRETRFLSRGEEDGSPTPEILLNFIEEVEQSEHEALLLAIYEEKVVGYGNITACLDRKKMKHKCDLNVSVLKDYWRLGIGKALMVALVDFAKAAGYEQINLTVANDNDAVVTLYQSLGFMETGKELHAMKHGNGDYSDFILMTKFLIS